MLFSESFNSAIEAKVTAEQNALKEYNQLKAVEYQAQQRVTQAKGEAEAIRIQAEAITQQGGKEYVQLQAISKWNGVMPLVTGGSMPFINMNISNN
jgi:regulator of protease activity HflC (stomatin/prohibitin superfamily)